MCRPYTHDTLTRYLEARRAEHSNIFRVEHPSAKRINVVFPFTLWLFNLALRLDWTEGRWTVQGSLELNPTRLLARMLEAQSPPGTPDLTTLDLLRNAGGVGGAPYPTLDGSDNVIPPDLVRGALGCDWPSFVQRAFDVVIEIVGEITGTAHDVATADADATPLLRLPPLSRWVPKEVEVYFEFEDAAAVTRVHEIADRGSAIAASYAQAEYELAPVPGRARERNAVAARFGLREGVHLSVYAKARDRVRAEVKYAGSVLKAANIVRRHHEVADEFWPAILRCCATNAADRLNQIIAAYKANLGVAEPRRHRLALLLADVARACEGDARLTLDVLSLLMANRGFTLNGDGALDRAVLALARSNVLQLTRAGLRATRSEYAISPRYAQTLDLLRRLMPL